MFQTVALRVPEYGGLLVCRHAQVPAASAQVVQVVEHPGRRVVHLAVVILFGKLLFTQNKINY